LIVLLLCGDKGTQHGDIADAKDHWAKYQAAKKALASGTPLLRPRE